MPVTTHSVYACDLCGAQETMPGASVVPLPTGWIKLTYQHVHEERSFYDRFICNDCVTAILNRAGPVLPRAKTEKEAPVPTVPPAQ